MNKKDYKTKETYSQLRLQLNGFNPDVLSTVLFEAGCLGIEEYSEQVWLVFFPKLNSEHLNALHQQLQRVNSSLQPGQLYFTDFDAKDWNAEWKKQYKAEKISRRTWVAPPWEKPEIPAEDILVIIDPQMAFGTGSHETTRMIIRAMEKYVRPGADVLDAGSGSGILSILAKKLGASLIIGFDIDEAAIENAEHNAKLNQVPGIQFIQGNERVIPAQQFDVICANLFRQAIMEMMAAFLDSLKENGFLLATGLLNSELAMIGEAIPAELKMVEKDELNDWVLIVLQKTAVMESLSDTEEINRSHNA